MFANNKIQMLIMTWVTGWGMTGGGRGWAEDGKGVKIRTTVTE